MASRHRVASQNARTKSSACEQNVCSSERIIGESSRSEPMKTLTSFATNCWIHRGIGGCKTKNVWKQPWMRKFSYTSFPGTLGKILLQNPSCHCFKTHLVNYINGDAATVQKCVIEGAFWSWSCRSIAQHTSQVMQSPLRTKCCSIDKSSHEIQGQCLGS